MISNKQFVPNSWALVLGQCSCIILMPAHPFIPIHEKNVIVHLRESGLSVKEVSSHLAHSELTVYRILALHRDTSHVVAQNLAPRRPHKLDMQQILVWSLMVYAKYQLFTLGQFLEDCIEWVADLYLDELQWLLLDECHVNIGISTIHRTLKWRGWTRKKVRSFLP